jgi:hypothetical protein
MVRLVPRSVSSLQTADRTSKKGFFMAIRVKRKKVIAKLKN